MLQTIVEACLVCLARGYTPVTAVGDLPQLEPGVMDVITQHVNAAWARRAGGILVGKSWNSSVHVEEAIPARHVQDHRGEIAFFPEVWEETYDTLLDRHPGSRIVGWYHSHPGTGPALSDYDRRLHSVLFSEAPSVALVVDPISRRATWYGWTLGQISPVEAPDSPVLVGRPARRSRVAVAAALALGVAAAGAAGYWVGQERVPDRVSPASIELRTRLGAERERVLALRQRLDVAQAEVKRLAARESAQTAELEAVKRRLGAARRAARRRPAAVSYQVQPGDSLWRLAEGFYGQGVAWKKIYGANRERLGNPNVLPAGESIEVPLP
jgi:proteasome lid subunit RPN8/RPN11